MSDQPNRIGTFNANGSVATWPEAAADGGTYEQPGSIYRLDSTRFVVLPTARFFDMATLDDLKPKAETPEPFAEVKREFKAKTD